MRQCPAPGQRRSPECEGGGRDALPPAGHRTDESPVAHTLTNAEDRSMTHTMKRAGAALMATLFLLSGCAYHPGVERGMDTFGRGMANLVLSPFMIIGGLAQGLAFLPYTIGMGLDDFNRALRDAQAVTMDDAYRATFHVTSIADPRVDQKTG